MPSCIRRNVLRSIAVLLSLGAAAAVNAQTLSAPMPNGGTAQGIRVSGWWKIDVKNPDGTVTRHIEFENALTSAGATNLVNLLTSQTSSGGFAITALGTPTGFAAGPCGIQCVSFPVGTTAFFDLNTGYCGATSGRNCTTNLNYQSSAAAITLNGSITATQGGSINSVGTSALLCNGGATTPANCKSSPSTLGDFTAQTLATPLVVTQGQIVQFTVVLSFS